MGVHIPRFFRPGGYVFGSSLDGFTSAVENNLLSLRRQRGEQVSPFSAAKRAAKVRKRPRLLVGGTNGTFATKIEVHLLPHPKTNVGLTMVLTNIQL